MKRFACLFTIVCALVASGLSARADAATVQAKPFTPLRRLFVSKRGNDRNNGLTPKAAFLTLTKATRTVKPGDMVLVSGGTYYEHVTLRTAGTEEHPIVFRAAPNETVVVTYGKRLGNWKKAPAGRDVYSTSCRPPVYLWEHRTISQYVPVHDHATLDGLPGSFLYDEDQGRLFVHPLRGLHPDVAQIVSIGHSKFPGYRRSPPGKLRKYKWGKGFCFAQPWNRVEGFTICYQPLGIQFRKDNCGVWNCTIYGCQFGVKFFRGENCTIAGNICFGNEHSGIHVGGRTNNTTVRDNYCWGNCETGPFQFQRGGGHPYQIAVYGSVGDLTFLRNTLVRKPPAGVLRYKSVKKRIVHGHNLIIGGSPGLGWGTGADYFNNTVVGGRIRVRGGGAAEPAEARKYNSTARDNLYVLPRVLRSGKGLGFADPIRHDYRLRKDSPYLGKGAFPKAAPLRYVSPEGDDLADGATPKTAWGTLAKAAASCVPGDTAYVLPGTYQESVTISRKGTREKPIAFKTHGRGRVVLEGNGKRDHGITLESAAYLTIDGFIVKGFRRSSVRVSGGRHIELVDNVLDGAETGILLDGCEHVALKNNTVCKGKRGIGTRRLKGTTVVRNNLFVDIAQASILSGQADSPRLISERNAVSGAAAKTWLERWQKQVREAHPTFVTNTTLVEPDYMLPMYSRLAFAGLGHKPIGARGGLPDQSPVRIEDFRVGALLPTQATVAWTTPKALANAELKWRTAGGKEGRERLVQDRYLKSTTFAAKLRGLAPGKTYKVSLAVKDLDNVRTGKAALTFITPHAARAPTTLYVAPTGNDKNDGTSRAKPFKTLSTASMAAVPGDTILVAPGVYPEMLHIWCGGISKDQRLTWRSEKRGAAIIDSGELRSSAILVRHVKHVTIDGFRFIGLMYGPQRKTVVVQNVEDFVFTNNIIEARRNTGRCTCDLFGMGNCRDVVIRNNMFKYPFDAFRAANCQNVTVDHNTFYLAAVAGVGIIGPKSKNWRITNNILMDLVDRHVNPGIGVYVQPDQFDISKELVCDYNLHWRKKCKGMSLFGFMRGPKPRTKGERAYTLAELRKKFNLGHHSRFGDPMFTDPKNGNFILKPGSPAKGMASDRGDVGMVPPPTQIK